MRHAEVCPLCGGSGVAGAYGKGNRPLPVGTACYTLCHGCNGKGWVEVEDGPTLRGRTSWRGDAFDFWNDPCEDVYGPTDGVPCD